MTYLLAAITALVVSLIIIGLNTEAKPPPPTHPVTHEELYHFFPKRH